MCGVCMIRFLWWIMVMCFYKMLEIGLFFICNFLNIEFVWLVSVKMWLVLELGGWNWLYEIGLGWMMDGSDGVLILLVREIGNEKVWY